MKAICGFFRLDGAPARDRDLAVLRAALLYNPARQFARLDGLCRGAIALGSAEWRARPFAEDDPQIHRDAESGCIAVVDARLDERDALAARLGLARGGRLGQAALILHAWLRWGEHCPAELYGDFAFAVWDPREQRLFCARDIMGVRPLHVHHTPGRLFAFASRAQALLSLPGVPADLDEGRIADALVLQLEGIDKTSTFYRAVQRLPPAHALRVQPQCAVATRYWRPEAGLVRMPTNDSEWTDAFGEVLERAVARHLDGTTRVGSMLSGGMDSSSLAVIARDRLAAAGRAALPTFSSVDDDPACAETHAIRAVLALPGFDPTVIDPAAIEGMRDELVTAAWASEEPFDGSMVLVHAQYLAAARRGVDAVMDGIDADLLLTEGAGLVRHLQRGRWLAAWRNARGHQRIYPGVPAWRSLAATAASAFLPAAARRRLSAWRLPGHEQRALDSSLIGAEFARRVHLRERLRRLRSWTPADASRERITQALRSLDHPYTTCGIERYHRVAAWHGVDPRHPFADRRLLEFCVNLPDEQRMAEGWSKLILRRAMRARLPDPVCWRIGKQHLGPDLAMRLLLRNPADVRQRLAACRAVLAPYVDAVKLDHAERSWQQPGHWAAAAQILGALHLGSWLSRFEATRQQIKV